MLNHGARIVTDGLVLCLDAANPKSYPGTGTTWYDLSGNGNDGTLVNGVGYSSDNNGSMVFDGVNDYATCGSNSIMNLGNISSIAAWIKTSNSGAWKWICQYGRHAPSKDRALVINNQNKALFYMYGTNAISTRSVTDNNWYYLVGTIDGISARIYVNGILETTVTATFGSYDYSGVRVGINDGLNSYRFNGSISNVIMYNRTLSPEEIQQNFNALRGRYGI